ncbi:MAG: PhnB protein [Candidatus Saccharibacteria bacterium]|nr:PhnB protein [Candidatus Saccharibacteria bacterium]
MEFYKTIFDGTLVLNTFKDPNASKNPDEDNFIMHALLTGDNGTTLMASDTLSYMEYEPGTSFSMSLSGDNKDELTTYFNKVSEGGMITDKFGIQWIVNTTKSKPLE